MQFTLPEYQGECREGGKRGKGLNSFSSSLAQIAKASKSNESRKGWPSTQILRNRQRSPSIAQSVQKSNNETACFMGKLSQVRSDSSVSSVTPYPTEKHRVREEWSVPRRQRYKIFTTCGLPSPTQPWVFEVIQLNELQRGLSTMCSISSQIITQHAY